MRIDISGDSLPNFKNLNGVDGVIYGRYNKVNSVNPYKCRFVAVYPDGKEIFGINLFTTGWDEIPNGLNGLRYELSTGHIIQIPKYKAYMPQIEVSFGMDGSRIFHFINVHCMAEKEVVIYKIVLREDQLSPQKIGDIIMSKQALPEIVCKSWKYTS